MDFDEVPDAVDTVAQSSNETYVRPTTRQRVHKSPPPLEVPHIEEDAEERKRVLNVLAQRRYRERKKLERQEKGGKSGIQRKGRVSKQAQALGHQKRTTDGDGDVDAILAALGDDGSTSNPGAGTEDFMFTGMPEQDLGNLSLDMRQAWPETGNLTLDLGQQASSSVLAGNSGWTGTGTDTGTGTGATPPPFSLQPGDTNANFAANPLDAFDPACLWDVGSSPDNSSWASIFTSAAGSDATWSPSSSSPRDSNAIPADSYLLVMNELVLLRAMTSIATRLGCSASKMWDISANSPFNDGVGTPSSLLPQSWRPTTIQVGTPHHPVMDFLPWPGVRDRIIGVMSLPYEMRPEGPARDPMALAYLAWDMEDSAEGVRIWGGDPYDADAWEVGQVFFERWWFVLDRAVVERSNQLRRERGAPELRLGPARGEPRVQEVS